MRYLAILFFFFIFHEASLGQYYQTGQDPASVRWLQIRTSRFRIIYPETYGQAGIDYARAIIRAGQEMEAIFPERKFKIPVVIHNYSTYSNAYVAWAPKRIEIYPAAEQNALPGDQFRLLSLHELTHVYQLRSLNRGFTGALSVLLGEQVTGAISALLPLWYLEGGAVVTETALTNSGRGRSPSFQKQFKAIALEKPRNYRYDKVLNGSYRDFVPDHYESGYQMVAWAMAKYDTAIWNRVLKFTGNFPFTVNPVNLSLRSYEGLTKRKLYRESFDSLRSVWSREIQDNSRNYEHLNPLRNDRYISYHSPVFAGNDNIIAIKTSLSSAPSIVLINSTTGTEKVLKKPGSVYPYFISSGGGRAVWVEKRPDPRWDNRDYSVIKVLDVEQGTARRISYRSRYLAAAVSPDGKSIAAVENTIDNRNNLVLLEAATGRVNRSLGTPSNLYIQKPEWSDDGTKVTLLYLTDSGEGIMAYSVADNRWETLIEAGNDDLQSAFLRNDSLFYVSSRSGTENIYVKTPSEKVVQLTGSGFGAVSPDFNGRNIIFSDYSARGNSIGITSLNNTFSNISPADSESFLINRINLKGRIPAETEPLQPERYRKLPNLLRFHSWMPFYADLDQIQSDPLSIRPGVTLMSQNILSTLIGTIGYEYSEDRMHVVHSGFTWQGQYPVIEANIDYGYLRSTYGQKVPPGLRFTTEMSVPLRFSTGYFSQYLRPSVNVEYSNSLLREAQNRYDYEQVNFTGRLFFSNYSRAAHRDIYPRFAQTIDLNYLFSPFDRDLVGSTAYLKTAFFLPGLFRDHGLRLRFEAEKQNPSMYIYPNRVSFPRGYNDIASPGGYGNIISHRLMLATADYVFPLAYPDLNLAGLFYLKRIRSGLFYDYASGKGNRYFNTTENGSSQTFIEGPERFWSYGAEVLADFHLFRIPFEISGGVRAAWIYPQDPPVWNIIFNIDLYGFSLGGKRPPHI